MMVANSDIAINALHSGVQISGDNILEYFPQKTGFDISCK